MFQGFYGLLTVMLCVLFAIVAILFNLAPITYIVFGIAIVLSLLLQYRRFKKQAISERIHSRIPWLVDNVYVVATGNIANTVAEINRKDIEVLYKKMF